MNRMYNDEFGRKTPNMNTQNSNSQKEDITEEDCIDYVIPEKKSKKRKNRHSVKPQAKTHSKGDEADFVYAQPHNKKKQKRKKVTKILIIILCIIASLLVLSVGAVLIFNQTGKIAMHDYSEMTVAPPVDEIEDVESVEDSGKTIKYKGETYAFNEKVTTVALMGIDIKDFTKTDKYIGESGQADAIYIAVIDTTKDKVTILGVSRDSIVDVNVYNKDGGFVNTEPMQICLSYAYGDGAHTSCENTIVSLERLLYGLTLNTYYSFDTRALKELTDAIGGVEVTATTEFFSPHYYRTVYPGETITLNGEDAIAYIRARDLTQLDSNNDRMSRQKQFISAFISTIWDSIKSKPSNIVSLYNIVAEYSTTNLTTSKMTYLTTSALSMLDSASEIEFVNIEGKVKKGEYAEFYVDQDALMQTILDLFYIKVS